MIYALAYSLVFELEVNIVENAMKNIPYCLFF